MITLYWCMVALTVAIILLAIHEDDPKITVTYKYIVALCWIIAVISLVGCSTLSPAEMEERAIDREIAAEQYERNVNYCLDNGLIYYTDDRAGSKRHQRWTCVHSDYIRGRIGL
jgi:hypothetical protein